MNVWPIFNSARNFFYLFFAVKEVYIYEEISYWHKPATSNTMISFAFVL